MMTKSVIVIGGGLGGIAAAIRMAQSGFNVKLFEQKIIILVVKSIA